MLGHIESTALHSYPKFGAIRTALYINIPLVTHPAITLYTLVWSDSACGYIWRVPTDPAFAFSFSILTETVFGLFISVCASLPVMWDDKDSPVQASGAPLWTGVTRAPWLMIFATASTILCRSSIERWRPFDAVVASTSNSAKLFFWFFSIQVAVVSCVWQWELHQHVCPLHMHPSVHVLTGQSLPFLLLSPTLTCS